MSTDKPLKTTSLTTTSYSTKQPQNLPHKQVLSSQPKKRTKKNSWVGLAFVAPAGIIVVVLFVVPLLLLLGMSFSDYPLLGTPTFVGIDNYSAIPHDSLFIGAIKFTLLYTALTTIGIFLLSFLLVAISIAPRRGAKFFRTAYFLPYVVGTAAAALLWSVNINDQVGFVTHLFRLVGIEDPGLLTTPDKALATTVVLVLWKFIGFQVMVLLVGLQAIPTELYEAARTDGANLFQRLWHITLPLLKPTLALLLMLSVTGSLLAFDQFFVLTGGGPDRSTVTMVMAIYNKAFSSYDLGSAASMSVILLIALVILNAIQLFILRKRD